MKKNILSILTFLLLFILSGCGSNSKPDGDASVDANDPIAVEMQNNYIVQDASGKNFTLAIPMTKKLDESYLVVLNGYGLTVDGCNMTVTPSYSPASLTLNGAYNSVESLYITGTFDQNCTVAGYTFTATQKVTKGNDVDTRPFRATFDYDNPGDGGGETPPTLAGYSFYNATTPLIISQANTAYTIKVQLLQDGFVASGNEVDLKPFSSTYGDIASYKVTTGSDGYANFDYTSPAVLPANGTSTSIEVRYMDENNATIKENIVLSFNTSGSGGVNPYSLVNSSSPIEVTGGNQDHNITAYVIDASTGVGVAGKTVTITTIANGYGSVNTATAATDTAGKVEFIYTSPVSITGLTSTTAKMRFTEDGVTSEQEVVINFTTPPGGGSQYSLMNETTPISVTSANEVKEISIYVVDSVTQIGIADKIVSITTIANGYGSVSSATATTDGSGKAAFSYTAPSDLTGLTSTTATLSFVEDGVTLRKTVTINVTPPAGGGGQYSLINETTPVFITRPGQVEIISINLVDSTTLVGVEGKMVTLSTPAFGSLTTSTTTTNAAGKAEFGYQAPSDLKGLTTTAIRFSFIEDSVTVTKDINITVNPTASASEYNLTNANDATVNYPTQGVEIAVQVIKNGAPVAGESVIAKSIPAAFGRIENATVTTGADGYARFNYIAADALTDGTQPLELVHIDLNGAEATASVNITVLAQTQPLTLSLVNETADINITHKDQVEIISVYVVNTTSNVGVAGKTVSISTIASGSGSVSSSTAVTDASGKAEFTYQAPSDITGLAATGTTLSFTEDSVTLTKAVTITFNEQIATSEYTLTNANDITVNYPTESGEIAVQVIKNGAPVAGESVTVKSIPVAFGRIENATVTTGADGYARFNYIAADILTDGTQPLELVHTDVNGAEVTTTVNITVLTQAKPLTLSLVNETADINITHKDQVEIISVYVVNTASNVGIAGETVSISTIASGSGNVNSATAVTDASGKAEFTYQAPSNITGLAATGATLSLTENGVTTNKPVTITFNEQIETSEYNLTNANDATVNYPTQSAEIAVQVTKNGAPVAGESVTVKSIPAAFGRIENATVTTGTDGYARFTYIAADTLTDGTQPLELVHTDVNGAESTATVDITVLEKALYEFINLSNITIEHGSQKEDIKAQLTYKGVPMAAKTVQMLAFSDGNGTILNGHTVETDSVGYATFFYMAPETLNDVNSTTLTLTMQFDEDAIHLEGNATLYFSETVDNIEGNVSLPIVVIPANQREIILDSNSKTVEIAIQVFKDIAPYAVGSVKVELPEKVLNGVDVGLFASYEVAVNEQGIAKFSYTGPSNLQALIGNDDNESIFKFYHVENSANKQPMKVLYQLPDNPHISRNYELDIVTSGDFSMGIPDKEKTFNVLLKAKDSAGNDVVLDDENITKITVLTTNSTIAQILDTVNGTLVNTLDLHTANNSPFILKSKELSGLVPVQVTVEFDDANGDAQSLTTIVNVRVFSGPASAISISYVSTGQDVERAKYIETLAISATDEYGNRVNTRPNITLGAIVGYAVDGAELSGNETNETKRLFYGRSDIEDGNANGEIVTLGANKANFEDITPARVDVFKYVNAEGNNTDKLVVFGERKNYEAMGKWDFNKTDNNTLSLQDNYYGVDRSGLYYAIGHNYYQDQCRDDGREWVGTTDSATYQLDEEGTVTITYKYDYHLTGKDALIWVNLDGIQPDTGAITRVGETVKHTLRGTGLVNVPEGGYTIAKGTAGYGTFIIWHENAPEHYRNGHFGWAPEAGSTCAATVVARSNAFDARTCDNGGSSDGGSYITFYLEAPIDKDCTFNLERILPSSEF